MITNAIGYVHLCRAISNGHVLLLFVFFLALLGLYSISFVHFRFCWTQLQVTFIHFDVLAAVVNYLSGVTCYHIGVIWWIHRNFSNLDETISQTLTCNSFMKEIWLEIGLEFWCRSLRRIWFFNGVTQAILWTTGGLIDNILTYPCWRKQSIATFKLISNRFIPFCFFLILLRTQFLCTRKQSLRLFTFLITFCLNFNRITRILFV